MRHDPAAAAVTIMLRSLKMHGMAQALLEWETIDSDQIDDIMGGKPPRPPKDWTPSASKPSGPSTPVGTDGAPAAA